MKHEEKNKFTLIGIGILAILAVGFLIFNIAGFLINPIMPTDTKIFKILEDNKKNLLSIDGIAGDGITPKKYQTRWVSLGFWLNESVRQANLKRKK